MAAGAEAGWEATPFPLVRIEETGTPALPAEALLPDWVAVTSSNALESLAEACEGRPDLRDVALACVGSSTASRAVELGLSPRLVPSEDAQNADGLAACLIGLASAGARVLWPRGDRARAFGRSLEDAGLVVDSPVVYRTLPVESSCERPEADAVLFASPSAVKAWCAASGHARPAAIAIGPTTLSALEPLAHLFSTIHSLAVPSPDSLQACLHSLPTSS